MNNIISQEGLNAALNENKTTLFCFQCDAPLQDIVVLKSVKLDEKGKVLSIENRPIFPVEKPLDLNKDFMCPICNKPFAKIRSIGVNRFIVWKTSSGEIAMPKGQAIL